MRILMVNYEYPPLGGGGGVAQRDLAQALVSRHEVTVLTTHFPDLPLSEQGNGVSIRRVRVWGRTARETATIRSMVSFVPAAFARGLLLTRHWRPDVIHATFAVPSGLPAVLLGRSLRVPVVVTLVGGDIFDPMPTAGIATHRNPVVRAVIRVVIRSAQARVAISRDTRDRAIRHHGAPDDIEVIPLGFVPPAMWKTPVPRNQREDRRFRFVTVGRLIPRKAYRDLLEAFAALQRPDIRLDVIGDGPLRDDLLARSDELNIESQVTFHGTVPENEKWNLLQSADCFVSASLYEGFGIVFLEAMYARLPIVATDSGGQTDVLTQGENALLVPAGSPAQLAAALRWILFDEELRLRLAAHGEERVRSSLIQEAAARYDEIYRRVLGRPGVPVAALSTGVAANDAERARVAERLAQP